MKHYYCAVDGGFYIAGIHSHIPPCAIEISLSNYQALLSEQADGKIIISGGEGIPQAVDPETLWSAQDRLDRMRCRRDALLTASDITQIADYPLRTELRAAWAAYRQQLRDLPETITDPADIFWPIPPTGADT